MKRVSVKNLAGVETHGATLDDPTDWINDCVAKNAWGLPDEYTVEIIDVTQEFELKKCFAQRIAEYPSAEDFLNVFFDGTAADMDALKTKRLAVKLKYPKPTA